jgi:hypothetical protein
VFDDLIHILQHIGAIQALKLGFDEASGDGQESAGIHTGLFLIFHGFHLLILLTTLSAISSLSLYIGYFIGIQRIPNSGKGVGIDIELIIDKLIGSLILCVDKVLELLDGVLALR